MLGQQSIFSSQDQLQEVQDISEYMVSAPSDPQHEAHSDPREYYEQCPKHGGPTRSHESNEDLVNPLSTRPEEMVVKESSGNLIKFTTKD
jgi:hypothetical protein